MTSFTGTLWQPDRTPLYGRIENISEAPVAQGGFGRIYRAIWNLKPRSMNVAVKVPLSEEELQRKAGQGTPLVSMGYVRSVSWR